MNEYDRFGNRVHSAAAKEAARWSEVWVGASGVQTVAEMDEKHVRNTLALILREARQGNGWFMNAVGAMRHKPIKSGPKLQGRRADVIVVDDPMSGMHDMIEGSSILDIKTKQFSYKPVADHARACSELFKRYNVQDVALAMDNAFLKSLLARSKTVRDRRLLLAV